MRITLTSFLSIFILFLCYVASNGAYRTIKSAHPENKPQITEINFFVDNRDLLKERILEIAFPAQNYLIHKILLTQNLHGNFAMGHFQGIVPKGALDIVLCGVVQCPGVSERDMEIFCGESQIPEQIDPDKIHELTFSTNGFCQTQSLF